MNIAELTKQLRDAVAKYEKIRSVNFALLKPDERYVVTHYSSLCNPANITLLLDAIDKLNGKLADYRAQELKAQEINLALEKKLEIVRREALDEARLAACEFCRRGILLDGNGHIDEDGDYFYCMSSEIRALIDKPVEERKSE